MKSLYDLVENKLGMDKVAHFLGIAFVAVLVSLLFAKTNAGESSWVYAATGLLAGFLVAVFKEVFDFLNNRAFDVKDILAGVAGGVVAFLAVGVLM